MKRVYPYIPNMVPEVQQEMLDYLGLESLDDLHADVPAEIKYQGKLNLPEAFSSEYELKRTVGHILNKNVSTDEYISFLGAGCWKHYVPAVCDEVNSRSEFLTAYAGDPYNDLGRFQSLFEYESLMAELLDTEVVSVPTFDWSQAAATSIRMASRNTGRGKALISGTVNPSRRAILKNYCNPDVELIDIAYDAKTGQMDLASLKELLSDEIACVYFENPSFLGFFEEQGQAIADLIHDQGGLLVVGVDPISLGIVNSPISYGADILCGDLQPLGIHMNYGGGVSGFISTKNRPELVMEYPSRLFGLVPTVVEGEYGFGDIAYERTSFGNLREKAKEFVGTQTALWGITAGVYLSVVGPEGMREVGETILYKMNYLTKKLAELPQVRAKRFASVPFKEVVVDFKQTGRDVKEINQRLLEEGIFGGYDLKDMPGLDGCALYCVTETTLKADIDRLIDALKQILSQEES